MSEAERVLTTRRSLSVPRAASLIRDHRSDHPSASDTLPVTVAQAMAAATGAKRSVRTGDDLNQFQPKPDDRQPQHGRYRDPDQHRYPMGKSRRPIGAAVE